jgi:aminopeptidase-like protein
MPRRLSYRFVFVPGTIGAIAWLHANREHVSRIRHGLVLTCAGDAWTRDLQAQRRGDAEIDRAVVHVLGHSGEPFELLDFSPDGYDERQYCSLRPSTSRSAALWTPHGRFPGVPHSADNLELVRPGRPRRLVMESAGGISVLEGNATYVNL